MSKELKITYFVPYDVANFSCKANDLKEAGALYKKFMTENCFCIESRHVKTQIFDGQKISDNKLPSIG